MKLKTKEGIYVKLSALFCAVVVVFDLCVLSPAVSSSHATAFTSGKVVAESVKTSEDNTTKNKNEEQGKSTVAAAADETVLGKIQNKFISPYTANTSYNNVYLKNSTDQKINLKELLSEDMGFNIEKNGEAEILIVHSHATESFMQENRDYYTSSDKSRSTDNSKNMVAVGEVLAKKLNNAGIKTIHSDTLHDYPDYNYSYTNSSKTVEQCLKENPGIKIVLDMHRDAVGGSPDKVKVTTKIGGKQAAQVMLVMGTDYKDYKENLKLAVHFQQTLEILYPGLARSISLVPYEYNQSLHKGSMLIEIGTDANTLEEAKYSAELVGDALISLCNSLS